MTATPQPWLRAATRILLGFAAAMLALIMVLRVPGIASEVPLTYNEGWNAYHAAAVRDGTTLYPSLAETGTVNNYPPISFLAIGTIARAGGDPIRIGRIANLIGLLITVIAMVGLVRRLGGARTFEATFFTVVVTLFPFLVPWHLYLGINDPQMLAHGIMLVAALLIVRAEGSVGATAGGAALMAVAGFTKHNLLPLPIAMLAWLLLSGQRRAVWAFLAGGLGAAAVLVAGAYAVWGNAFFESLLFTPRVTRWDRIPDMGRMFLPTVAPLVVLACGMAIVRRAHPLSVAYFIASTVICTLSLSGEGVWSSGVFDLGLATALVVASTLSVSAPGAEVSPARPDAAIVLLVGCLLAFTSLHVARQEVWDFRNNGLDKRTRAHQSTITVLRAETGEVACDHAADCFRAGLPWQWDAFNVGQALKLDRSAGRDFLADVEAQRYKLITIPLWRNPDPERFPDKLLVALHDHYEPIDSTASPVILLPR